MIGLKRGVVKIMPYSPDWPHAFASEEKRLAQKIGSFALAIEHIGSTAVPMLSAKPIVDIMVGVSKMRSARKYVRQIERAGYAWRPKFGRLDQHIVFARGDGATNTNYLHLVRYDGKIWRDRLAFRDYLRSHHASLREYEKLKKNLAREHSADRKSYTAAKQAFIKKILAKILKQTIRANSR